MFSPKNAEFFDFEAICSFSNTHSLWGVKRDKSAVEFIFIVFVFVLKINLLAVSFSIITSSGKIVFKAPKALSKPMLPSCANQTLVFCVQYLMGCDRM